MKDLKIKIQPKKPLRTEQLASHYEKKFLADAYPLPENLPMGPFVPITYGEFQEAAKKLKSGKAAGPDELTGEELNLLSAASMEKLTDLSNDAMSRNDTAPINTGILVPIPKPNKQTRVENTRPIILLPVIRKVMDKIVLERRRNFGKNDFLGPKSDSFGLKPQSLRDF